MPCDIEQFRDFYHNGHTHLALEDFDLVLDFGFAAAFGFPASLRKPVGTSVAGPGSRSRSGVATVVTTRELMQNAGFNV